MRIVLHPLTNVILISLSIFSLLWTKAIFVLLVVFFLFIYDGTFISKIKVFLIFLDIFRFVLVILFTLDQATVSHPRVTLMPSVFLFLAGIIFVDSPSAWLSSLPSWQAILLPYLPYLSPVVYNGEVMKEMDLGKWRTLLDSLRQGRFPENIFSSMEFLVWIPVRRPGRGELWGGGGRGGTVLREGEYGDRRSAVRRRYCLIEKSV